ncbi:tRNA (guanosine(37)-N1)-methyltransferase TrmD [Halobacteriovorax sp. HLS]|uniref:tRNA (guanosine(37)-N1)-methyltransferase TrmD n=1 Tax=Halobacteriovorax sp. HLS TaxID=2234000 RepID=UPI000FDBCE88|nr:tRNA (guanosine(37)-N1)-methyltransferase TrmD [Halobacteriovorax sp. HLS]
MSKRIWILTMFPNFFDQFREVGVVGQMFQGLRGDKIELCTLNISDFSPKGFKGVDSSPYGGGPGMVMRADVLKSAIIDGVVKQGGYSEDFKDELKVIFTAPRGITWNNKVCREFSNRYFSSNSNTDLVFICGRYEGIDERFLEKYVDEVYCIGDFVLSGGEIAVMSILDSALRFSEGVLGNNESAKYDSFEQNLLEHPQYTRPSSFEGLDVPAVLMSGDHQKIQEWKNKKQVAMTQKWRPELIDKEK